MIWSESAGLQSGGNNSSPQILRIPPCVSGTNRLLFRSAATFRRSVADVLAAARFHLLAESGWRKTKLTFEGAVKGRLRLIANSISDLRNATARGLEHLCYELKPPASQVGNGRLRQITPEALGQYGTRKFLHRSNRGPEELVEQV
jgi:hypothetical protein